MVRAYTLLGAVLPLAAAWPQVMEMNEKLQSEKRQQSFPDVPAPLFESGRQNTGAQGNAVGFDEKDQFVDVRQGSGHEFQAPRSGDLRGQCPGLNAAANHAYLPRNGIATIQDTVEGLGAAYNMAPDLSAILAVISIAISGDIPSQRWSIGAGFPGTLPLLGQPTGIVGTHNRYEGDASIIRGDAYLHGGNVGFFEMHKWENLYAMGEELTHDMAARQTMYNTMYSIQNNPYYFSAPFSGLVAPDAHNFVINFMSNHSAEKPGGTLTREILKDFFSVTGEPGNFVHTPGQERIPENWYRRPTANALTTLGTNLDTLVNNQMYPGIIRFGGNMGKVNTFTGVDLADMTGGVFNGANLLQGNNLACFTLQATQAGLVDALGPVLGGLGQLTSFLTKNLGPFQQQFGCPQLGSFKNGLFQQFPGASYKAQGQ